MDQPGPSTSSSSAAEGGNPQKLARPHRCNDRVEDLLQALFTLEYTAKIRPAWTQLMACLRSEIGSEPQGGHVCVKNPQQYLDPLQMRRPSAKH